MEDLVGEADGEGGRTLSAIAAAACPAAPLHGPASVTPLESLVLLASLLGVRAAPPSPPFLPLRALPSHYTPLLPGASFPSVQALASDTHAAPVSPSSVAVRGGPRQPPAFPPFLAEGAFVAAADAAAAGGAAAAPTPVPLVSRLAFLGAAGGGGAAAGGGASAAAAASLRSSLLAEVQVGGGALG